MHEYEGILGRLQPTIKPLLRPHLEDMETKIAPGFSLLVWTSMNIDGYMHRFKQVRERCTWAHAHTRMHTHSHTHMHLLTHAHTCTHTHTHDTYSYAHTYTC